MDPSEITMLILIIILILLSSFFSSAETAFTTVSAIQIRTLIEEEQNKKAMLVNKIINDKQNGNYAVSISAGVLTVVILIFGEITPKSLASISALKLSMFYCRIIYALMWILTPVIYVINILSRAVLFLLS